MKRALASIAVLLVIVAACGELDSITPSSTAASGVGSEPASSSVPSPTEFTFPDGDEAEVVRIFDGDSFEAEINGQVFEVRMLGINAPERDECHGNVARERLRELIDDTELILVGEGEDAEDRFGRLLRSVYTADGFVNGIMVAEGHAVALQGGDPQERTLVELSDAAWSAQAGMWSRKACDEDSIADIAITEIEYDPSGRDWENKTEEWIVIRNEGDESIDLSDWVLRDESSTHRYEFRRGETLDAGAELRIRTGCGDDRRNDRYWCADDAVWSNGGDTVILQSAAGTVVSRFRYDGDY